ncbi:MAG TPA: S8 family serine peptidase [Candidatus Saccharimonadales bacterium]|nr:S8 family serine peptidase [Candidatus Saccharimonadales bacterium]
MAAPIVAAPRSSDSKLAPELIARRSTAGPLDKARVIVLMDGGAVESGRDRARDLGGAPGRALGLVHGFVATLDQDSIETLAADPHVRRITPDRKVRPSMEFAGPAVGAPQLSRPEGLTGAGVTIAVIDSGIYPHEDLPGLIGYVDFLEPNAPFSRDRYGHGTHVAGIIAGQAHPDPSAEGLAFGGIAPGASLISLRVLDANGEGYVSDVISAVNWAVSNKDLYGIRILNLSLGHPVAEPASLDPLARACEEAWRDGLLVVASAGNLGVYGNGTITSPANDPLLLAVGAADDMASADPSDDAIAPYSSRGPSLFDLYVKPDLVAPGHALVSLRSPHSSLDVQHPEARVSLGDGSAHGANEPRYFRMSGSSMAAAVVSGAAALMLEGDPDLTPDTIKARFMAAARRMHTDSVFDRGAGELDLSASLAFPGSALLAVSPEASEEGGLVELHLASDLWSSDGEWTLEELYGDPDQWNTALIVDNGLLADPCVTGNGLIWQGLGSEGLIWQGNSGLSTDTVSNEGLIWQGNSGLSTDTVSNEGLIWQGVMSESTCTSQAGQIWQGGLIWQGQQTSGEGLIWQGRVGF